MARPCANSRYFCKKTVSNRSKFKECRDCRRHDSRWANRSTHDKRNYYEQLGLRTCRMRQVLPANVVSIAVSAKRA